MESMDKEGAHGKIDRRELARRAFKIWEGAGRPKGFDRKFWLSWLKSEKESAQAGKPHAHHSDDRQISTSSRKTHS